MSSLPLSRSGRGATEVATQAAEEAGSILLKHFHGQKHVTRKPGRANVVSDVDLLSEKVILDVLQDEYPQCSILSEESANTGPESQYAWIVDPIDGTNNYTYGIPVFSVAIALVEGDTVLFGLVYDPLRKELFHAEKGRGAFVNGCPISVSKRPNIEVSLIGYDMGYNAEVGDVTFGIIQALWPGVHGFRIMGSAALGLAYVASGRLDLYFHPSLYPWDMAGGILLVSEAGGKATDFQGAPATCYHQQLIASNGIVHKEFEAKARKQLADRK